ncbi:hypothetical protein [Pedobacter sandarakinus]|uniref:hypothetical protein n=1 Tax=Pedobacter sandarakinus TaxID=353156 RepID=UPI0022456781|nr:hypothetical protein [Pedobacter sandarakinus]MCX2573511.1 hypothetical protein [Pedobacter sandarakinus]
MPEIIIGSIVLALLLSPQILAGFLAKRTGRKFWFWFLISFLIPVISLIILVLLEDKNPSVASYERAPHVGNRES